MDNQRLYFRVWTTSLLSTQHVHLHTRSGGYILPAVGVHTIN
jgi:hypothetical protein